MTIDALVDPEISLIAAAAGRADVRGAFDSARGVLADLRFHEGLRRGWEEARAEAGVREATALAILMGARTSVDDLRIASLKDARGEGRAADDPAMDAALGAWRAQFHLVSLLPPLNTRTSALHRPPAFPALIASLHRDLCSALVESGRLDPSGVAIPADPVRLAYAIRLLGSGLGAIESAAALVAHFRVREVFTPASAAVGAALARWILTVRGVDPTGVCVISAADALDQAGGVRDLAGWVSVDEDGLARWMIHFADSIVYGAEVGADIALHVQARKLS